VTEDQEALARVIASEVGRGTEAERAAVGWTVRNRARRRSVSIARLVCHPACGPQWEAEGKLRPFSSARDASEADRWLAAGILAASDDPTKGAIAFIEPALQDELAAAKRLGHRPYREVRAKWIADGMKPIGQVGRFELWTR
jgi:spore germination cell wall hydrolase CwlJ-like protein